MYVEAILEAESANQAVKGGSSGENCVDQNSIDQQGRQMWSRAARTQ